MNKIIKIFLNLSLTLMFVVSTALVVNAHTTKQNNTLQSNTITQYGDGVLYVGGESVGWSIAETRHAGTASSGVMTMTYKWGTSNTAYRDCYRAGAKLWQSCGNIVENSSSTNTLGNFYQPPTPAGGIPSAKFYDYAVNSTTGHLTSWKISLNEYLGSIYSKEKWATVLAHEFGHAFGLNDLFREDSLVLTNAIYNRNKLMFGYDDARTATKPTTADVNGFNVITGIHTTHSFSSSSPSGTICTSCNGRKK